MLVRFQFWPVGSVPTPANERKTRAINPTTVGDVIDSHHSFCEMTLRSGEKFMVAGSFDEILSRLELPRAEAAVQVGVAAPA